MACGGAQVRNVRDLVPVRQATAGMADHDGGFSYVHRRATKPAAVGRRSAGEVARRFGTGRADHITVGR